jgi:hypothetical protein
MSATNLHNTDALILGTAEFYFSPGAISATDAKKKGFVDYGNILSVSLAPNVTKQEHKASRRGIRVTDRTAITETKLQYTLKLDEIDREKLYFALLGSEAKSLSQAALTAAVGLPIVLSATSPSKDNVWYDLASSDGKRVSKITELILEATDELVEGVDYELDNLLGRVRFLQPQSGTISTTISAPAISESEAMKGINPLTQAVRKGYAQLAIFDDNHRDKVVYRHVDFSCEISFNAINEFDGQNFSELTLDVLVTSDPGTVFSAE